MSVDVFSLLDPDEEDNFLDKLHEEIEEIQEELEETLSTHNK